MDQVKARLNTNEGTDDFHGKTIAFGNKCVPYLADQKAPPAASKSLSLFILFLNMIEND